MFPLILAIASAATCPAAHSATITVDAQASARLCEPVEVEVRVARLPAYALVTTKGRPPEPAQVSKGSAEGTARVTWIVRDLPAGEKRTYRLSFRPREAAVPPDTGVVLSQPADGRLDIALRGQPFTTYHFASDLPRPFYFPVVGVRGERLTRAFPLEAGVPGETTDHTHHRSFWFAFGAVNGVDCWAEGAGSGRTVHRAFEALESGPVYGLVRSVNDWLAPDGKKLMEDVRELRVYDVGPDLRLLDFAITLRATEGPVTLGDTKEGMFGFRVASTMDVKPDGSGGRIENSEGGVNESQTWGKRAEWCDYSGPVAGEVSGIAMMDHPANLRHPTYWMVRDYGLFACNPFGVRAYTGDPAADGSYTIPSGDSLTLRYRLVLHSGNAQAANIAGLWGSYAEPMGAQVKASR